MSQVTTTMAMTTISPVTVVSSGMSSLSSVTMAPSLMGLPTMLGQHATQSAVPQPSHLYGGAYSFGGLAEIQPIPLPSLHGGEGSSFPGLVPSDDTVNSKSAMGIKPGDSGVVIKYQVDEFTHTWSAEWFVAHSHIYPGFTGKVSSLTHFPFE